MIGDNFKILVYNSNNEPILSAKPNIDFNDDHQKISPKKGYPIIYKSGQDPEDIRVCAQQEYSSNGTTYLHNDCYPIKQNVQKTYWYTIFDYGEIDGFKADSNLVARSNEMTTATDTITPENEVSNFGNILSINDSSAEMIATQMKFQQEDTILDLIFYHLKDYTFVVSNNNPLCDGQNCKFEFKETDLTPQSGSNDITVSGIMRIDTGEVTKILNVFLDFQPIEERKENGKTIQTVEGTFRIGKEPINEADYEYNINGTLVTSGKYKTLSLQGIRCNGLQDDPNKPIDCDY